MGQWVRHISRSLVFARPGAYWAPGSCQVCVGGGGVSNFVNSSRTAPGQPVYKTIHSTLAITRQYCSLVVPGNTENRKQCNSSTRMAIWMGDQNSSFFASTFCVAAKPFVPSM